MKSTVSTAQDLGLCYTQIGGLCVATFITLLLVPVLYSIFVLDLKILKWETKEQKPEMAGSALGGGVDQRS